MGVSIETFGESIPELVYINFLAFDLHKIISKLTFDEDEDIDNLVKNFAIFFGEIISYRLER